IEVADVAAVDDDRAGVGVVHAGEELGDARLAGASDADEGGDVAGGDGERDVVQYRPANVRIGEVDVVEGHVAPQLFDGLSVVALDRKDGRLEGLAQPPPRHPELDHL